jgi:hypothetical protein
MEQQQSIFKKKELVIAVSVALLSGVMSGCSTDSDSDKSVPAVGAYTINATGGTALNSSTAVEGGYGGSGGELSASLDGGTGGIKVLASGKANAAFSSIVPAVSANLGSNPLNVAANATVEVAELWADPVADATAVGYGSIYIGTDGVLRTDDGDGVAEYAVDADLEVSDDRLYSSGSELYVAAATAGANLAPAGTLYTHEPDDLWSNIYTADGSAATADAPHTGIAVASGATLTLALNSSGYIAITVASDIKNDGTITTADNGTSRGDMALFAHNYLATGTIDTSGTEAANSGGAVVLYTTYALQNSGSIDTSGALDAAGYGGSGGEIGLYSAGYLKNSGAIDTSGADSATLYGGSGGEVTIYAAYIENSGVLTARGGNSASGYSGNGAGSIYMNADFGVNNSGDLTATGGIGDDGGEAGYVHLTTDTMGTVRNSGTITSSGGNGTVGYAGYKASVWLEADGGDVINSGDIITAGGSGVTGLSYSSNQGEGGNIRFATYPGDGNTAPGNVIVSGNLDTRGGNLSAADGVGYAGDAGRIYLEVNMDGGEMVPMRERSTSFPPYAVSDQSITLLGYTHIDASGGSGLYAGYAGGVNLRASATMDGASLEYKTGPVVNEVDITARGGDAIVVAELTTYAEGRPGGSVYMRTAWDEARLNTATVVSNSGDIDVGGGNSYSSSSDWYGMSGSIALSGYHGATNSGTLSANGGNDTSAGTGSYGGYAQSLNFEAAVGAVVNSGALSNNGGDGDYLGGRSDGIRMYGATVKNSGALSSNGGNADATLVGSIGGDGGESTLWGSGGLSAVSNSGTLSYSGGTGETAGDEGSVWVGITCVGNCTP